MAHVRAVIAGIAPNNSAERFTGLGVVVLRGEARFIDRETVVGGECPRSAPAASSSLLARARRFRRSPVSRRFPISPTRRSSISKRLPSPPGRHRRRPGRTGAGAGAFAGSASEVTVLEARARSSPTTIPSSSRCFSRRCASEGIDIREGAQVTRVTRRGRTAHAPHAGRRGRRRDHRRDASPHRHRPPAGLDEPRPEEARHRLRRARASKSIAGSGPRNRRVYAIGDVVGRPAFHPLGRAIRPASSSARSSSASAEELRPDSCPGSPSPIPELAHVGLSEAEARSPLPKGLGPALAASPRTTAPRPSARTRGLVKVSHDTERPDPRRRTSSATTPAS